MAELIAPRTLKGFRDYPPAAMMSREWLIDTAKRVYRSFGFAPIDTPALEYLEILTGKGSEETDRQLYAFEDQGGRKVGMRFDLTVPLARFVAQHAADLPLPFKRYQVGAVWRGESPQQGRYREFVQCDFDTVGTTSAAADAETALVIHELLAAIGVGGFKIRINNRQILTGLLAKFELADQSTAVLRGLDKLDKIGPGKVADELRTTTNASDEQIAAVLQLAEISGGTDQVLAQLQPLIAGNELAERGAARLEEVVRAVLAGGVPADRLVIDVSIARGLDYYTGVILETFLDDLPQIGSVCSGGRYDNLAGLFTKQELPGIGASLGVDRLLAALEQLGKLPQRATPVEALIVQFSAERLGDYFKLASQLRAQGVGVEVFPEAKRLKQQLKYADRQQFRFAILAGDDEFAAGKVQLKELATGDSRELPLDAAEIAQALRK